MSRIWILLAVAAVPSVTFGAKPIDGFGVEAYGGSQGVLSAADLCERGTIFNALKVVRAYRDNEAFAFKHLEGREIEISGRLVAVKRDIIPVEGVPTEFFVALVTPDGKPPEKFGLEFRFPAQTLKDRPELACQVAELWAGQFVTLRGFCRGPLKSPDTEYVGIIFNDAQIVD
ncbi:MAG: hypothetical protein WD872_19225 [Pirellulaceae bacterium]